MRNQHPLLKITLLLFSFTLVHCAKNPGNDKFSFNFSSQKPINIFFYKTESDYLLNTNPYLSMRSDSTGVYIFPVNKLQAGIKYYLDLYSDDFTYNNWAHENYPTTIQWTGGLGITMSYGLPLDTQNIRKTYLNSNGTESSWKPIDAGYGERDSRWNSLTDNERYRRIKIKKDYTGLYIKKTNGGQDTTQVFKFSPDSRILEMKKLSEDNIYGNMESSKAYGTDTVIVWLLDNPYRWVFVKERL